MAKLQPALPTPSELSKTMFLVTVVHKNDHWAFSLEIGGHPSRCFQSKLKAGKKFKRIKRYHYV
jgi:hypothetical protein